MEKKRELIQLLTAPDDVRQEDGDDTMRWHEALDFAKANYMVCSLWSIHELLELHCVCVALSLSINDLITSCV